MIRETSTEALVKSRVRELESGLERAVLNGQYFIVHIDHAGREITYDLRGAQKARRDGLTHLIWDDLDGNIIKCDLRRLDEK
jgi:hypothetical protein